MSLNLLSVESLYFALPDNFKGGLSAALRALADYHDTVAGSPKQTISGGNHGLDITLADYRDAVFTSFWDMLHGDTGCKVIGELSISRYNPKINDLERLDINTGNPEES